MDKNSLAGVAFRNITKRILGEEVPLLNLEPTTSWFEKLKRFVTRS